MSNVGQAALSIVGGVVGFVYGGPAGAAWGLQLGGLAGSALFPTDLGTVSGPRLTDLSVQTSTVGAPIPIVYGTYAVSGNVIWSSGIIETVSRKKQGGKGGPTQTVKTYTYKVHCAVGVCEGEITGIVRIWADAKLIYDAREQLEGESDEDYLARTSANAALLASTEMYLGTEDQLADPTIESIEGAGNVSGFRGLAYVVFTDFQLADYGNRVPNFRFEVASAGIMTCETVAAYTVPYMPRLAWENVDPRVAGGSYRYHQSYGVNPTPDAGSGEDWVSSLSAAVAAKSASLPYTLGTTIIGVQALSASAFSVGYMTPGPYACGHDPADPFFSAFAVVHVSAVSADDQWCQDFGEWTIEGVLTGPDVYSRYTTLPVHWIPYASYTINHTGIVQLISRTGPNEMQGIAIDAELPTSGSWWTLGGNDYNLAIVYDDVVVIEQLPTAPPSPCELLGTPSEIPGYCLIDGKYVLETAEWELVSGSARCLNAYSRTGTFPSVTGLPWRGPVLPTGHANDTQAWWEAAYVSARDALLVPTGWVYGTHYPDSISEYYSTEYEACTVAGLEGSITLGTIVRDLCERAGLEASQIDVSDLTEFVDGYAIGSVMTARDAIAPLRSYGFFDCVESDGVLKWPTRGKAAVATIVEDDLASHEASESRPSAVETSRAQTVELPRRLRVHYAQTAQNYEPGEQCASRVSSGAEEIRDIEVAVAMSDAKAAQIAEVVLYDLWVSRNTHRITLDHSYLELEPADAITVPIDGRQERLRIVSIGHKLPGLVQIEAVRDDDGAYVSYAIGAPAAYAGTGGGSIASPGEAELVLLDLPLLRDADNDAGYYAAVHSIGGTVWSGAAIYRSPDGGTTYDEVATVIEEATVGELVSSLPSGPTTIIDEGNELVIALASGELESVSEASLLAGLNAAAIGVDGRWEVIQFRDATFEAGSPDVWRLSGLLRGRRGTEWAVGTSEAADTFVMLDSALVRVSMNLAALGTERKHKAVLSGASIDAATAVDFTGNGVALEPFSVVDVEGAREPDDDLVITWVRRGRIGSELAGSGVDIPLSEESEAYEIDIVDTDSPPNVLRTLTSTTQTVTYTAAQQATDFGSPVPESVTVRIYQMSAAAGRGYPSEATI